MTPLELVNYDGDSEPNTPVYQIAEAMREDLVISSADREWKVVSYYYHPRVKRMVLEITEDEPLTEEELRTLARIIEEQEAKR